MAGAGLVAGKTLGVDATTLEANAAMRSIVRRDTGGDYTAFLTRLATASGIETPTAEELARFDRKRKKKKTSNQDWTHPHDPDAKVAKMKDGSTHLAHKVEHAVDLETGAVVGVTIQGADKGDTTTMVETLVTATEQGEAVLPEAEVVADKGYHSNGTMVDPAAGFGAALRSRTGAGGAGSTRRRLGTRCKESRQNNLFVLAASLLCSGVMNAVTQAVQGKSLLSHTPSSEGGLNLPCLIE